MINRLVRWAIWSPTHLAVTVAGMIVVLLLTALVFKPTGSDRPSGGGSSGTTSELSGARTGDDAEDPFADFTDDPDGATSEAPLLVTTPPADDSTLAAPQSKEVSELYRRFTVAWLGGLGAASRPTWVEQVCDQGCTPYLHQMLGTTATAAIPDATVARVVVDEVGESQATGRVRLSDGRWLRLTAEWDGQRWLVAEIEAA